VVTAELRAQMLGTAAPQFWGGFFLIIAQKRIATKRQVKARLTRLKREFAPETTQLLQRAASPRQEAEKEKQRCKVRTMQTSNALDPQSPQARAIYDLAIHSTIIFALIFVIVTGAILYAIFRFRARAGEPDPKQIPGNRKVEIAWTIIPFLIVIFLLVMTLSAMNRADPPPPPSPDLVVTGHQFWWQVDYPGS